CAPSSSPTSTSARSSAATCCGGPSRSTRCARPWPGSTGSSCSGTRWSSRRAGPAARWRSPASRSPRSAARSAAGT
ncbi:MAG: hypothetical protein AVDCRST_MAG30-611, partial [uncultured Solirubrobacteraceae bacterium]